MLVPTGNGIKSIDDYEIDEVQFKKDAFNQIKHLKFSDKEFTWYILTRKNVEDYKLYCNILNREHLKSTYKKILRNIKKHGTWDMEYYQLINIYLSKKFNKYKLKPMCEAAMRTSKR